MVTYSSLSHPHLPYHAGTAISWNDLSIRSCPLVKFILRPVLTILIMAPISLCVLALWAASSAMVWSTSCWPLKRSAPKDRPSTVIGAFMPFLVMTGMHYSPLPAYVNSLSMLGYETVIGPGNLPSNIAQVPRPLRCHQDQKQELPSAGRFRRCTPLLA